MKQPNDLQLEHAILTMLLPLLHGFEANVSYSDEE
jgi:hypothetical protein